MNANEAKTEARAAAGTERRITTTAFLRGHTVRVDGAIVGNIAIVRKGYRAPGKPARASLHEAISDLTEAG